MATAVKAQAVVVTAVTAAAPVPIASSSSSSSSSSSAAAAAAAPPPRPSSASSLSSSGAPAKRVWSETEILGNAMGYSPEPLLGQKKPTPSRGSGIRVFYESLLTQNADSYMALKWCVEHGVYPGDWEPKKANELLEKKKLFLKENGHLPGQSGGASSSGGGAAAAAAAAGAPAKKKKRAGAKGSNIIDSTAVSGELSGLGGGGWEAAGRSDL